ncbi:MAG: hypothetical protein ACT4QE_08595 [Anaerolineales bacterium]
MRRIIVTITIIFLITLLVRPVEAQGNSPSQLAQAGWLCLSFGDLGVHCMPPGAFVSSETVTARVFDTTDPAALEAPFLGTALFIQVDLYNGQPCPQQGLDQFTPLDFTGDGVTDYYGCWRY